QSDGSSEQPGKAATASAPGDAPASPAKSSAQSSPASKSPDNGSSARTAEELRRTKSSPLVRRIAEEHGVDIAGLEGTGMSGRVTKNDILSFIESGSSGARVGSPAT